MTWFKRIALFLVLNVIIMLTVSAILSVLGVGSYIGKAGLDLRSLAVFSLVWGFAGAFISLALSRVMAKWMMGVQVINPQEATGQDRKLLQTVYNLAGRAGLRTMPEVGVYDSPDLNAFATGPSKSRALVAVSSGLLARMSDAEIEGVLGHEIAHVANGDMVTMTLIQGLVNAFVMFLSRAAAWVISQAMRGEKDEESSGPGMSYFIIQFVLEIVFMIVGSMVVAWVSRKREFKADIGGAQLAGKQKMIAALQGLQRSLEMPIADSFQSESALQTLQISSRKRNFFKLFSTHPDLDVRIEQLRQNINIH